MKLDYGSIKKWFLDRPAMLIGLLVAVVLAVFLFFGWFIGSCQRYFGNRELDRINQNINAVQTNANQVNANLANLALQNVNAQINVNIANQNYTNSMEKTNAEKNLTNNLLSNVNAIRNGNFAGSSYANANAARCRAYPESCR